MKHEASSAEGSNPTMAMNYRGQKKRESSIESARNRIDSSNRSQGTAAGAPEQHRSDESGRRRRACS